MGEKISFIDLFGTELEIEDEYAREQLSGEAAARAEDVAVLSARMDTFTALPDGSTAGDAELTDIRVGADGTTYANAGDAVRKQITDANNSISDIYDNSYTPTMINGKYIQYSNGNVLNSDNSSCTDFIPVTPNEKIRLKNLYLTGDRAVCWYKTNGFGGNFAYNTTDTELLITIPEEAVAIKATAKINETVEVHFVDQLNAQLSSLSERIDAEENKPCIIMLPFEWEKFIKPNDFDMNIPFNIYTDGINFKTDFKFENFKNSGGSTYYVQPNGSPANNGLTRASATSFAHAYNMASDNDTIILLEADYDRNSLDWGNTIIQKSINIIGEGKCRIFAGQLNMAFTKTPNSTNVYQTTRANAVRVIDYKTLNEYMCYKLASSVNEVDDIEGSYYIDGSTVYVHALGHNNPSSLVCVTVLSEKWLNVYNNNQNTKVCYQNIELIGKPDGVLFNKASSNNELIVICDNVNGYYCGDGTRDCFRVYGGTVIFNNCIGNYSFKDGFNHNGVNISNETVDCNVVELNCTGSNCGLLQTDESQNGSTAHASAKVLRINGKYYNNFGANVADVQQNTKSLNLGCNAFFSAGSQSGANENFSAQQAGTVMWLFGCVGVGATKDINGVTGSTVNMDKCVYKIKAGNGTFNETNTIPFDIYTLYKLNQIM